MLILEKGKNTQGLFKYNEETSLFGVEATSWGYPDLFIEDRVDTNLLIVRQRRWGLFLHFNKAPLKILEQDSDSITNGGLGREM